MKKRAYGYSRWRWRSLWYTLLVSVLIIVAFVKFQDLLARDKATLPHIIDPFKPKLAFLFLARHVMPLDVLWERFFEVWFSY